MNKRKKPSKNVRSKRRIALRIAFGLLAAIICGEVLLRFVLGNCALGRLMEFDSSQKPCVELIPNSSVEHTGVFTKIPNVTHSINKYGYRGKARGPEKSGDIFRVIIVGDSFTFCPGVEDGADYPSRLEYYLRRSGKTDAQVLNFGVPGLNLEEVGEHIRFRALEFHPDLVIAQIAGNDFDPSMCVSLSLRRRATETLAAYSYLARALFIFSVRRYEDAASHDERVARVRRFIDDLSGMIAEADVAIMAIGFGDPLELGDDFIGRIFARRNIPYFPFPKSAEQYLTLDVGHLTVEGCDQYGRFLANRLN